MRRVRERAGFTLLELLLVVMLIGFLSTFLLGFPGSSAGLRSSGRVVAAELEYASQRAVATGAIVRLEVDLDEQRFRLTQLDLRDEADVGPPTSSELLDLAPPLPPSEFVPVDNATGDWRRLRDSDVVIAAISVGDRRNETGTVSMAFAPDGGADPAELWLVDAEGYALRVRVVGFSSEVVVEDADYAR